MGMSCHNHYVDADRSVLERWLADAAGVQFILTGGEHKHRISHTSPSLLFVPM